MEPEMSLIHAFFDCVKNGETAVYILRLARIYDTELGEEKALRLDFNTDMKYKLAMAVILISGLHFICDATLKLIDRPRLP